MHAYAVAAAAAAAQKQYCSHYDLQLSAPLCLAGTLGPKPLVTFLSRLQVERRHSTKPWKRLLVYIRWHVDLECTMFALRALLEGTTWRWTTGL